MHRFSPVLFIFFVARNSQDNLAEDQNRRLCQHSRRGAVDATAKPNRVEKERIDKLVNQVTNHMTTEDIDLLYRYVLVLLVPTLFFRK